MGRGKIARITGKIKNIARLNSPLRAWRVKKGRKEMAKSGARYPTCVTEGQMIEMAKKFFGNFPETVLKGKKGMEFVIGATTTSYESHRGISLQLRECGKKEAKTKLAAIKIGFDGKAVIVEAMQGREAAKRSSMKGNETVQQWVERFREMHGKHWPNALLEKLEQYAKKQGFSEVRIRVPESLYFYHHPYVESWAKQDIQLQMESLYRKAAKSAGYKRKGFFYVKKI